MAKAIHWRLQQGSQYGCYGGSCDGDHGWLGLHGRSCRLGLVSSEEGCFGSHMLEVMLAQTQPAGSDTDVRACLCKRLPDFQTDRVPHSCL